MTRAFATFRQPVRVAALVAFSGLCTVQAVAADPPGVKPPPRKAVVAPVQAAREAQPAMLDFLLAEFAGNRGAAEPGAEALLALAERSGDSAIAQRAVELALRARNLQLAIKASSLWLGLDPESQAGAYLADMLGESRQLDTAEKQVTDLITSAKNKAPLLMHLNMLFARFAKKDEVRTVIDRIAGRYPDLAESSYAMGWAAFLANDFQAAGTNADQALQRKPAWEKAAVLKLAAIRKRSAADAFAFAESFLKTNPAAEDLRQNYARDLAGERRYKEARREFEMLARQRPQDASIAFSNALLAQQLNDLTEAEAEYNRALMLNYRDEDAVASNLAQIAELKKDYPAAIEWLHRISAPEAKKGAERRIASLIGKTEGLAAARTYLAQLPTDSNGDRIQVVLTEAQLLRDARQYDAAFEVLDKELVKFPNEPDLMYDHAMAAERVGRYDVLEKNLRALIELKPDFAHAYNALGYTFAERSERLAEAKSLIEKAISLSPDDPFILDSLGWVNYRLGNLVDAAKHLQQAYDARSDPEIAAHLSEVLWAKGKKDEALALVRKALADHPEHEMLTAVLHKLKP